MKGLKSLGRWLGMGAALTALSTGGAGCLSRPVGEQPPTTKVNFGSTVSQQAVDKVDLLFMIDNSASMGDKQQILAEAVPVLIDGLLKPRCVNPNTGEPSGNAVADPNGGRSNNFNCPTGTEPEFAPVTDMHIGIISSSLGAMGGGADVCPDSGRYNDRARLLTGSEPAASSGFLAWFPQNEANQDTRRHPPPSNPTRTIPDLTASFGKMVEAVGQDGCGLEAQLESFYRFLIQPDPWVQVTVDQGSKLASLGTDVDVELLQQRADFLRPDSLVAVILLTDEDDSSADPLSLGGQGYAFMSATFPGSKIYRNNDQNRGTTAPRGTSACTDPSRGPGHPDCTSCAFTNLAVVQNDPACKVSGLPGSNGVGYDGYYGPDDDDLNVRFHRMKERFGVDPQYPISRYVDGLTKFKVPDRESEHPTEVGPDGSRRIANYQSTPKCTNPLFAATLPRNVGDEICNLPRSSRSPDLIFFAVVGGVPNELLHFVPNDPEASRVTPNDFQKILGRDPKNFDFTGIDPHMIQSVAPRNGLPAPTSARGDNGSDAVHGREWDTLKQDLQFACTFPLIQPTTCTDDDPSCDCANQAKNPPLCGTTLGEQTRAKAYPTIREFMVVRELRDQGIIASLCPIQLNNPGAPDYGYNPAVAAIIDRLKNALTTQCLPQQLTREADTNQVPCLVLAQLEQGDSCDAHGLEPPPKEILDVFLEQQRAESGNVGEDGVDLSRLPVCELPQAVVTKGETCKDNASIDWCYVENDVAAGRTPAGRCPQALIFSAGTQALQQARFTLQCIQQFEPGRAAGDETAAQN